MRSTCRPYFASGVQRFSAAAQNQYPLILRNGQRPHALNAVVDSHVVGIVAAGFNPRSATGVERKPAATQKQVATSE
ncbi:hypothetical protein DFP91_3257 [Pseudorhodoplanes sinuspersici]|nr:hypothetical protein DFP91_3257 [Pseudorhodoplanes sinuspersici]